MRSNVNDGLRERAGSFSRGFAIQRALLVIVETALACILLTGAGLALSSLWSFSGVDLGFNPANVLTFRIAVPATFTGQQVTEFYRQILDRVRSIPGVDSAVIARNLPMSGGDPSMPITVDGKNPAPVQGEIVTRYRAVGEGYFRTLQIPILRGRAFDAGDTASSSFVAIVSRSLTKNPFFFFFFFFFGGGGGGARLSMSEDRPPPPPPDASVDPVHRIIMAMKDRGKLGGPSGLTEPISRLVERLVDRGGQENTSKSRERLQAGGAILASLDLNLTGASRAQLADFDLGRSQTTPARLLALEPAARSGLKGETALLALPVAQASRSRRPTTGRSVLDHPRAGPGRTQD